MGFFFNITQILRNLDGWTWKKKLHKVELDHIMVFGLITNLKFTVHVYNLFLTPGTHYRPKTRFSDAQKRQNTERDIVVVRLGSYLKFLNHFIW